MSFNICICLIESSRQPEKLKKLHHRLYALGGDLESKPRATENIMIFCLIIASTPPTTWSAFVAAVAPLECSPWGSCSEADGANWTCIGPMRVEGYFD